jgi:hypothetical protein
LSVELARKQLGESLKPALPEFAVFPAPGGLDEITKPTLHLMRTRVEKLPQAPAGAYSHSFDLWVIAPQHASEDRLDELLDDVLEALDETSRTLWTDATRDSYSDTNPAYRITLTTTSKRKA